MRLPQKNLGALPLYVQLSELVIREIEAGRLIDGERLPPEREMARTYGTSIGTLRKALADLERKGLLRRVQGSGNYIQKPKSLPGLYAMFRLELPDGGGLPTAQVLSIDAMQKPNDLPQFGKSGYATRICRLRALNDIPIALEEIWLDAGVGTLNREHLSDSLYQTYLRRLNFWVTRAEDRVTTATFPSWTPEDLAQPGAVSGYIERTSWADGRDAVEFSRTWFEPTRAVYVQRLK